MDPTNIKELLHAIKIELLRYRYAILFLFIIASSATLLAGYLTPKTYTSRVALYADVTNIIGNLLKGTAEITNIDRAKEARDIIFTDRILRGVASESGFVDPDAAVATLRSRMKISANGDYVNISYSSQSKDQSFNVVHSVTSSFLSETSRKKREESQSAFDFIDAQVSTYKKQLEDAEQALKEFSAQNIDVTESSVSSRVTKYKNDIQILELEIQDNESRLASFESQLKNEAEFLKVEIEPFPSFEERQLESFEQQLADLRLSYLDTHPDIVSLKDQIELLSVKVESVKLEAQQNKKYSQVENPAYTNLKEAINTERAELNARRIRLGNTKQLLETEMSNAETVADKQAQHSRLTRDYAVTKDVYEDLLKRRESARLSMTLDIEGQGVSYKIHEPATYPVKSDGLQLMHYALAGPAIGLFLPIGLIIALVILDPRIRSASFMQDNLPAHITVMATIPMYNSAISEMASKRGLILMVAILLLYMALYGWVSTSFSSLSFLPFL